MKRRFILLAVTFCLGIAVGYTVCLFTIVRGQSQTIRLLSEAQATDSQERAIVSALETFKLDHGSFPHGSNPAVVAALVGNPPSQPGYIVFHSGRVDAHGNVTDAWGLPYQFGFYADQQMFIRSAGPDHLYSTSDDIVRTAN